MKVAIIGGTGFVGSHIVEAADRCGHELSLLVRAGSEGKIPRGEHSRVVTGDVASSEALDATLSGCDAVIYCVGILRAYPRRGITFESLQYEGVVHTVESAIRCGVRRFVLMSANGVKLPGTPYQETKQRAEEVVAGSGLDATIFRPSVIFGDPHGRMEFATQLCRDMVRPFLPAVGFYSGMRPSSGQVLMSPVHVDDVATAFAVSLSDESTVGRTVVLGGPEVLSWPEMIRRIAAAVGRRKWIVPVPIAAMRLAAKLFDWLPFFPVTRDQLTMLAEGNTAGCGDLEALIGRSAVAFDTTSLEYLRV